MDMVVHQDIRMNLDGVVTAGIAQKAAVVMPILIVDEDRTAVHAALRNVHRNAGDFDSGLTGHGLVRDEKHAACKVEVFSGIRLELIRGWANPQMGTEGIKRA